MKIGIDLTELKKELNEVKKNNENKNEIIQKSVLDINNYQYINFTDDPEIDDFLNDKSFKILDFTYEWSYICLCQSDLLHLVS